MVPFHFGPAPATDPVSQEGGFCSSSGSSSGSSSSSSSSSRTVVRNFLLKIFGVKNLTSQFTGACFFHRKVRVLCFTLQVHYLKGQINWFYIFVKIFAYFFSLNMGSELEPVWPLFSRLWLRLQPKRAAPGGSRSGSSQKGRLPLRLPTLATGMQHCLYQY